MKIVLFIARTALALTYLYYGLDYFFHIGQFLHHTKAVAHHGAAMKAIVVHTKALAFLNGLDTAGYFFPFMKFIEISSAFFLLINRFTAFFSVMIFPVTINIFFYHTFLAPGGLYVGALMIAANLFLGFAYFDYYRPLFAFKPAVNIFGNKVKTGSDETSKNSD